MSSFTNTNIFFFHSSHLDLFSTIKTIQDKKFNNTIVTYVTTMKIMKTGGITKESFWFLYCDFGMKISFTALALGLNRCLKQNNYSYGIGKVGDL